jgi:hypothetical protein
MIDPSHHQAYLQARRRVVALIWPLLRHVSLEHPTDLASASIRAIRHLRPASSPTQCGASVLHCNRNQYRYAAPAFNSELSTLPWFGSSKFA